MSPQCMWLNCIEMAAPNYLHHNQIQNEDRQRLVMCFEDGNGWRELARTLTRNLNTARSIVCVWVKEKSCGQAQAWRSSTHQGRRRNKAMCSAFNRHPFLTLQTLNIQLRARLSNKLQLSISTPARLLDLQLIICKIVGKDADIPCERNRPATIQSCKEFAQFFMQLKMMWFLRHTFPVFTGLGRCPIVSWDFAGAVSISGPYALPVVHQ